MPVVPSDGAERRRLLAAHPWRFEAAVNCDLHVGRKTFTLLHDNGFADIAADLRRRRHAARRPRDLARIWEAWRDGYTDSMVDTAGCRARRSSAAGAR